MPLTHTTRFSQEAGDKSVNAAGNAATRRDDVVRASAGAETVPLVNDSSGNAIASVSPLSLDERSSAKARLQKS